MNHAIVDKIIVGYSQLGITAIGIDLPT